MVRMNVLFPDSTMEELGRVVSRRKRTAFVNAAVREKLDRIRQENAIRETAASWGSEGRADPTGEVERLREEWDERTAASSSREEVHG